MEMLTADRLDDLARRYRLKAGTEADPRVRSVLLRMAEDYERQAKDLK